METLWQDLSYAARQFRKNPGFTFAAVLTLTLGIGANTAIFSLIDAVMFRALPVRDPANLIVFQWTAHHAPKTKGEYSFMPCPSISRSSANNSNGETGCSFSYPMYREFQSLHDVFAGIAALGGDVGLNLRTNGTASFAKGELVSGEFFSVLGVPAALGRTLIPSDDEQGAPPAVELSYGYWQSAFAGDRGIVGRTIWINKIQVTVVGVAAREFPDLNPARSTNLWLPLSLKPRIGQDLYGSLGGDKPSLEAGDENWWIYVIARTKAGVTSRRAMDAADTVFRNSLKQSKNLFDAQDFPKLVGLPATQAMTTLRDRLSEPLTILISAAGMVLLSACFNVAGLLLARAAIREREVAVRLALGAGKGRIIQQLLTESVALATSGGIGGALLAYWLAPTLVTLMSHGGNWPAHIHAVVDLRVLAFTLLISTITGLFFGLAPALRSVHNSVSSELKTGAVSSLSASHSQFSLRGGLVAAQISVSLLTLTTAGLLLRTLQNLKSVDPGFKQQDVLLFGIDPTLSGYDEIQTRNLYSQLQERIASVRGVASVSYSFDPLLSGNLWRTSFRINGQKQTREDLADGLSVGPNFFETMSIPLLSGRTMGSTDWASSNKQWCPVIVNKAFVDRFFPGENPLGRQISGLENGSKFCEIIGVVGDAKYKSLRSEINPTLYVPQIGEGTTFEIRTTADPQVIVPAIREIIAQHDRDLPIFNVQTQSSIIESSISQERLIARLSSCFAGLSLLLACVGLYSSLSFEVASRTREIGVRIALGAREGDVLRLVIGRGALLCAIGTGFGIVAALVAVRFLKSILYGVSADDPLTLAGVVALLTAVAFLASYIPARRATKVDPMVALRYE